MAARPRGHAAAHPRGGQAGILRPWHGGARVDRIAEKAGANKRMLYYHVGNKEDLYLAVLEGAYEKIRAEERELDLEHLDPPQRSSG